MFKVNNKDTRTTPVKCRDKVSDFSLAKFLKVQATQHHEIVSLVDLWYRSHVSHLGNIKKIVKKERVKENRSKRIFTLFQKHYIQLYEITFTFQARN